MRNSRLLAAAGAGAVLMLAACNSGPPDGPDAPPPGNASTGGGTAALAMDSTRQAPAAPVEGAVAGGTVTVMNRQELDGVSVSTMDPTEVYWPVAGSILSGLVTRSLTQYVYDTERRSMVLVPDIATDLGTANADFTQWMFTIRDGVRFEDGTEVTAEDVAYGIKRSFDRSAFPGGATYSNDYFLDGDTYNGPYRSGTSYDGVEVQGDTLTVTMARPFPDMPYWASFPAMGPILERGSDPATYGRHPSATGPYKFAEYTPRKSLMLVRNDEWDPDTDPGRHAYPNRYEFDFTVPLDRIAATILGDSEQALTTLTDDNVQLADYRRAQELDRLTLGSAPCTHWWAPDYREITDIRVRQAIGYAYPYRAEAGQNGTIFNVTFLPGTSLLPPGFPGRENYTVLGRGPGRTDPDQARELLRSAGFAPGEYQLKFLYVESDAASVREMHVLASAMEAAGFDARPKAVSTYDEFFAVNDDPNAPIDIRPGGWCSDWPSGRSWFPHLLHSAGDQNDAYFSEPAIDDEMGRISLLPIDEQPAAWGTLDESIMTDYYPIIITDYRGVAVLHGSKIGGMNNDETLGEPTWKNIHVLK